MNNDVMGQVLQKVGMRSGVDTKKADTGRNYLQVGITYRSSFVDTKSDVS